MKITRYTGIFTWANKKKCLGKISPCEHIKNFTWKNLIELDFSCFAKDKQEQFKLFTE